VAERAITPMHSWEDFAFGRKRASAMIRLPERLVLIATRKSRANPHDHKVPDPRFHRHRGTSLLGGCGPRPGPQHPSPCRRPYLITNNTFPADLAQQTFARRLARPARLAGGARLHPDLDVCDRRPR